MKLRDFLDYNYLSSLESNIEETYFAYIKTKANEAKNNYDTELYVHDGEKAHRALNMKNNNAFYFESEHTILVPFNKTDSDKEAIKEMKTVLYRYDIKLKTFNKAHTLNVPVSNLVVIDEETWMITTSLTEKGHILYEDSANREDYIESLKTQELYEEITSIPFYRDGGDFIRDAHSQVLLYNPKTRTYKRLFDKDIKVQFSDYNKDTKKLYFLTQKHTGVHELYADAYVYDLKNKSLTCVFENQKSLSISYFFEIKNTFYFLASDMKGMGLNSNNHFYKVENGKATLSHEYGYSSYNSTGSDSRYGSNKTVRILDDCLYFIGTYQDHSPLYTFDGTLTTHFSQGSIDGYIRFKDKWIAIGMFDSKLQELYTLDLKHQNKIQMSDYNEEITKDKYVANPIYHSFNNGDTQLDGWVLLPQNYDPNKSYPGILDIHGGPKTIYNDNFFHEMQVWVNLGYIVFYCNPRGGDSYGDDFADIRGQYGGIDYDDIMVFTDFILEHYSLDEKRMGVTGGSYGGFMTNWIVSHTNRFKAAATQRSISNWISFYGTSDIGYYFGPDQTDADPIEDFEKAWEQSPLKHAHQIETPLLFIHSDKDYRCPIEQAMQLYTVVKKRGVDTRFIWFKNESHGLSRDGKPKARIKRLEEITNWMNLYLMD